MAQLQIVSGSEISTPTGGVKMSADSFRQAALAPGKIAQEIGQDFGGLADDISQKIQQNRNAQDVFKADLSMRKTKDDFTADLVNMPDPGTWLPAWKEKVNEQRQTIMSDPSAGPAVKRRLTPMFDQWEQATTSEIKIQALRKQVADTTAIAKTDAGYAAAQGQLDDANNIIKAAVENHADSVEMRNFAKALPGIAAKSQALRVIDADPGNAPDILRKDETYQKAMGPVVFNSVLGAAHEKQNQFFAQNYNDLRETMREANGINPEVLQQAVKTNQITQRMADSLTNLMKADMYQNDKGTYDFARTMIQDHDWANDLNPQETKRKFRETFPLKNNQLDYAFNQSLDAAIAKAKKVDDKEEAPVRKQIFSQLREDRADNGYTTPSFDVVSKGNWKFWPFTREEDSTQRRQLLGGLSALRNPDKLTDKQVEEFYGKGVTRNQVVQAEQDKYNTIQEKMRDWFDDPKNKDADYDMARDYLRKLEAPYIMPAATQQIKQATGKKEEALSWAMAHPNDPRAAQIKAKLGVK